MSDERERQALAVYERCRAQDQLRWYEGRLAEFRSARAQAVTVTGVLLILTTTASALAAADAGGQRTLWAVLATVFPALTTALAGYVALHGYHPVDKLYGDAVASLLHVRLDAPGATPEAQAEGPDDLGVYIARVEGVLRREQSQWGQLASDARPPPSADDEPEA